MSAVGNKKVESELNEKLSDRGFRFTQQRQQVYNVLLGKRDHPTADRVFMRAKKAMPEISMATVYNCLGALVKCGLARQVTVDRGATRFCPNMQEHVHFHCEDCGGVFDLDFPAAKILIPKGFKAERFDVAIHGRCPACGKN